MRVSTCWRAWPLAAGCVLSVAGCTAHLATRADTPGAQVREGIVYHLPRTVLMVSINYSIYQPVGVEAELVPDNNLSKIGRSILRTRDGKPVVINNAGQRVPVGDGDKLSAAGEHYAVVLLKKPVSNSKLIAIADGPVAVLRSSEADPGMAFLLDPEALSAFAVDVEKGKIEITEDGVLTGISTVFDDKSKEVVSGLVASGISVAKLAVGLLGDRSEGTSWTELAPISQVSVAIPVRLSEFEVQESGKDLIWTSDVQPSQLGTYKGALLDDCNIQKITIRMNAPGTLARSIKMTARALEESSALSRSKNQSGALKGLVFRAPGPVTLSVCAGPFPKCEATKHLPSSVPIATEQMTMGEAGGFLFMPIESRAFSKRTYGLTLSKSTGGITEFTFDATAQAPAITGMLSTQAESAQKAFTDWDTQRINAETARLNAERELIEAKKKLEDARSGG